MCVTSQLAVFGMHLGSKCPIDIDEAERSILEDQAACATLWIRRYPRLALLNGTGAGGVELFLAAQNV